MRQTAKNVSFLGLIGSFFCGNLYESAAINIQRSGMSVAHSIAHRQVQRYKKHNGGNMLRKILPLLMVLGSLAVAACNTVHGMGQDIERGGEATQDAADAVKKKL